MANSTAGKTRQLQRALCHTAKWKANAGGRRTSESRMRENRVHGSMKGSRGGPLGQPGETVTRSQPKGGDQARHHLWRLGAS
jgi:hypothetical protein